MNTSDLKTKVSKILTEGLFGYAGEGKISDTNRSIFQGKSNHLESDNGVYHDEWFIPSHIGGGQELVKINDDQYTRLYGGGTLAPEKLIEIGTTDKEVGEYLKKMIIELTDKTRLFEEAKPEPEGDWQYSYELLFKNKEIDVYVFVEIIKYKEIVVHIHPIILSPVK